MPYSKRRVKRELIRKFGFEEVEGSKHEAIAFYYCGEKVATTRFSRGSVRDIDNNILNFMAKEVRVYRLGFFKDMIDCPKSLEDYINRLKELHYIS